MSGATFLDIEAAALIQPPDTVNENIEAGG